MPAEHFVNGHRLEPPFPQGLERAIFGMGCFWGAEKEFWQLPGVYSTAVGYAGGKTPNPTYREVCSGMTGHNETVLVVFDPKIVRYDGSPQGVLGKTTIRTQGMRQGNDVGTQYRSGIYYYGAWSQKQAVAESSRDAFQKELARAPGTRRSRPRFFPRPSSLYYAESITTSDISRRTPTATAASGGTGVEAVGQLD